MWLAAPCGRDVNSVLRCIFFDVGNVRALVSELMAKGLMNQAFMDRTTKILDAEIPPG
jgi:hypothetical protein